MSDEKFYKEELMEHFKYPQNKKKIDDPDFSSAQENPSCGDKISIQGKVSKDGQIIELGFDGSGCVISQAMASMLTEKCKGKKIDEVLKMNSEDLLKMLGLQLGQVRLRCALLSLQVLQDALSKLNLKK